MEPEPRSMRRVISSSSVSLNCEGARRAALSSVRATSAMLRPGRVALPLKMMSSISSPRMRLAEVSPITQRNASTRLDLPQPLGPTMPVTPGSIINSVGSTKDLKPVSLSFANCTIARSLSFQSGLRLNLFDDLDEALDRLRPAHLVSVDDEGGGGIDAVFRLRILGAFDDGVLARGVGQACIDRGLVHA